MSANLLDGATVTRGTKDADGYWVLSQNDGTDKKDSPMWRIDGQPTLTENQTMHLACSVMPDEDLSTNAINMGIEYKDAAGNANWVGTYAGKNTKAGVWTRLEMECVVPSGMRVDWGLLSNAYSRSSGAKVTGVTISYGSPVVLASSAHTPYATQDHVSVTYATKASLKVTDDSVKAEVSARAQTDQNVADLSSRLTQTANSLSSEISDRKSAITTVTGLANAAQSTADAAKSSASSAVSTANSASTSAASAVDTANSASSTASAASTAAGKASTDAASAVKTANSASTTANSAVTTANSAKSTADAAKTSASSAVSTANAAKTMATENQSSIKQLSDSITSEVTERGKLAGRVGTLESTSSTHTSRLQQLAASITSLVKGESTYTDPDGKSATSGIYSLITQTRDSVTALFGQYTKTADLASTAAVKDAKKAGTDAQAAASAAQTTADSAKSAAQAAASDAATAKTNAASAVSTANSASTSAANAVETANAASSTASSASSTANSAASTANAAKTSAASAVSTANSANSTANTAKSTADSLATMIREDATGITVGKSADGKTYATGRTLQTADAFKVLDKAGNVLSSFGANLIELGKNSVDAAIRMLGGLATMEATKLNDVTGLLIASDAVDVVASGGGGARLFSSFGKVSNHTAVWSALASELPTLYAECTDLSANGEEVVTNKVAMTPLGFELSRPDAMRSALGLGAAETYQAATTDPTLTYDSTTVLRWGRVCVMTIAVHYTSDWAPSEYAFFELPEGVRPSVEQRGIVTSCPHNWTSDYRPTLVDIGTDGKVRLSGHAAGHWLGQLVWVV